jgi:hypothetical protein
LGDAPRRAAQAAGTRPARHRGGDRTARHADLEAPFTAAWQRAWERRVRAGVALEPRDFDPLGKTAGRDRIRLAETLPPLEHRALAPRLMANLNPYEMPLLARLEDEGLPRTVTEGLPTAGGALDRLCDWAGMRHNGLDTLKSRIVTGGRSLPHDTAEGLATLGLTADWAEGFTFFHPVPDLPAIARAAERWRRTAAGLWSYGRTRPRAWTGGAAPDAVAHLSAQAWEGRTAEEMRAALLFWARCDSIGEGEAAAEALGAATLRRRLGRRYARAADAAVNARDADPLAAALSRLQKDSVPAVLAAPLAAAAVRGLVFDDIVGRDSDA